MNNQTVIKLENITKVYKLYNSPQDRLKEALNPFRKSYHKNFYALKNINLEVKKGDALGIIGSNGAGKSTLLKAITGVVTPSSGEIYINGRISAMLELGTGFNPNFSGKENIFFKSSLMGFSKSEIENMLDDIIEFADIGEFINQPVKNYSSGMFVRLAFAVAVNVNPDILILDEVMSVGDMRFAQKAIRKMEEILQSSSALIYVSHDVNSIINLCNRAIWLKDGEVKYSGNPKDVVERYKSFNYIQNENNKIKPDKSLSKNVNTKEIDIEFDNPLSNSEVDTGNVQITGISLYKINDRKKTNVIYGNTNVSLFIRFDIIKKIKNPIIGFLVKNQLGTEIFASNTFVENFDLKNLKSGSYYFEFNFDFPNVKSGKYSFDIAIADGEQYDHIQQEYFFDAIIIEVINENKYQFGLFNIDVKKMKLNKN